MVQIAAPPRRRDGRAPSPSPGVMHATPPPRCHGALAFAPVNHGRQCRRRPQPRPHLPPPTLSHDLCRHVSAFGGPSSSSSALGGPSSSSGQICVWRPVLILIRAPPPAISAAASSPPSPVISVAVRTWVRSDLRLVAIPVLILFLAPTPTLHPISDLGEDDKVIVERCARERSRPPAAPHHRREATRGDAQAVTLFLLHPRPPLGPRGRAIQRGTVLPIKMITEVQDYWELGHVWWRRRAAGLGFVGNTLAEEVYIYIFTRK
ncbi:putative low-specificity L-threonine aldolase 1 [Zea mays]|uniref:Putative low-specificity L-threonine aldolase 1 n=1 Tax=Zea mays TaxID=4577 RepID=A0A1D6K3T9_MAIZE|nr:putative low-specificity L-threonine aldolase 1 [Zea mays]